MNNVAKKTNPATLDHIDLLAERVEFDLADVGCTVSRLAYSAEVAEDRRTQEALLARLVKLRTLIEGHLENVMHHAWSIDDQLERAADRAKVAEVPPATEAC